MGRWTVLSDSGGPTYSFGPGFDVNGTTITWALTDPSNMLFDPGFENTPDLKNWSQSSAGAFTIDSSVFYQGTRSAKTATAGTYLYQKLYAHHADQYIAGMFYRTSSGATGTATIAIVYKNAAGTVLTNPFSTVSGSTAWANATCDGPAPANVATMEVWIRMDAGATGTWYFDDISLRRIAAGDVIQVGAIDTQHLVAGSLGDLSKYSSTVRAVAVVSGLPALPSANYPQGSIIFNTATGKLYRADTSTTWSKSSDPADLIAGTIASGVIYAGTINCGQINAGTLNSNVIYSGTINANQVNAGDFTGCTLELTRNGLTSTFNNAAAGGSGVSYASVASVASGHRCYLGEAGITADNGTAGDWYFALIGTPTPGGRLSLGDGAGNSEVQLDKGGLICFDAAQQPVIQLGSSIVLRQTQTGWGAASGSLSRAAFNTGTVSTATVAQILGALITDLRTHGIIGN